MKTLVQGGTIVTAARTYKSDVLIEGERIRDIADSLPVTAADGVIDASGMLILPGGIDVHTHLDMPFGGTTSSDDFETGTKADELIEGTISQRVKGGLSVTIRGGVKAFLPGSQVDLRPVRNLDAFIGKSYKFKVVIK